MSESFRFATFGSVAGLFGIFLVGFISTMFGLNFPWLKAVYWWSGFSVGSFLMAYAYRDK